MLIDTAGRMQDNEVCCQWPNNYRGFGTDSPLFCLLQPLMRALAKVCSATAVCGCSAASRFPVSFITDPVSRGPQLVATNNPDKILFVGEALVGNEAVDQLTKFDRALRDFSAASGAQERGIDGMLVTKWDTVDDKVRAIVCFL